MTPPAPDLAARRRAAPPTARRLLVVVVALLAAASAAWSAGVVSAHAELLSISPTDGSTLQAAPAEVDLHFSEHVSLTGGTARVLDDQARVVSGAAEVDGTNVVIPLGSDLADGTYTVSWDIISEDSHPVSGATVFFIGAPSPGGGAIVPVASGAGWGVRAGAAALTALAYAGALVAVGGWWVFMSVADVAADERAFRRRARALVGRAAVLGAVALVAAVPLRIARLGGGLGALRENDLLAESLRGPIGVSTTITAAALLALAALTEPVRASRRRTTGLVASAVGLVALGGFVVEGHTRSQRPIPLMMAFDVLHLAAGAVWLGGIALLVVAFRSDLRPAALAGIVGRFSSVAVVAVVAVVAGGVGMAWIVLPSLGDLFSTGYGLALLTKAALVVPVIAMGAYNRRRLVPAMADTARSGLVVAGEATSAERDVGSGGVDTVVEAEPDTDVATAAGTRLRRVLTVELGLLLAVVGATSVLVNRSPVASSAAPAAAPVATVAPTAVELALTSGAGTATYTLAPARAGQNEMVLTLRDPTGQPLEPVEPPTVELTEPDLGVGPLRPLVHPLDAGEFHVIADIPLAGTYQMVIRVRVSDFDAASAETTVVIG